jgi:hypothetical protein
MTDQQEIDRGREARMVLDSPAYKEAMALMRETVVDKWKACPIRDQEGQRLLLQMMRLADTFEEVLAGMVERGKYAHHVLQKKQMDEKINEARNETPARRFMRRVL